MPTPTVAAPAQTPQPAAPAANPLFAQPGENFTQYEARVAGSNSGNAGSTPAPAPVATPAATPAPAATPGVASPVGITADQYKLQPGETTDQYNARIAGLRNAAGEATPPTNPTDTTSAEDKVAQSLGYKSFADAEAQLSATPTTSETDTYNSAYSAAGLDTLLNEITSRENDLATATGKINDNPWLDEASRVGRVRNLQDLANADIKNLQDEYNAKLKSVQDLVTRQVADQTNTSKSNAAKLANLEAQAKLIASQNTTAAKTASAAPKTIKGADGATYKWNPTTNTFDQILPGKATTATGGGKAPVPAASPTGTGPQFSNFNFTATQLGKLNASGLNQADANGILQDIKSGQTLDNIRQQMTTSGLDPGLLDQIMLYVDPAHNTPAKKQTSSSSSGRAL